MARELGRPWALSRMWDGSPGMVAAVFSGVVLALFLIVSGIMYGATAFIVLGVMVLVLWFGVLAIVKELFDALLAWVGELLEEDTDGRGAGGLPGDRGGHDPMGGGAVVDPRPQSIGGTLSVPEPGICPDCGGKLFLGRTHCPHCSAPVESVEW